MLHSKRMRPGNEEMPVQGAQQEMLKQENCRVDPTNEQYGLRILIIKDHQDGAIAEAALLRLFGHTVQIAHAGMEDIEAARADKPDVVLLDIGLPNMNGYDVARQLVKERTNGRPLVIAVTGCDEAERQRSAEVGIDLHLLKPVEHNELISKLREFQKSIHRDGR
jgi:CheY-like chemotaxis protein